jgi:hypothetical protein
MATDFLKMKPEIQQSKGLLKEVKQVQMMPDKKAMANLSLNKVRQIIELNENYVKANFSDTLKLLIRTEYALYKENEMRIIGNSLNYFLHTHFQRTEKFPELQKYFLQMKQRYANENDRTFEDIMGETTSELFPLMNLIIMSTANAAKSRAGSSLENHIENLLNILQYQFEAQQYVDTVKVDFVFPNLNYLMQHPRNSFILCSQTTLKDRFRLAISQVPALSNVRKYLVTATGAGVITGRDTGDLTPQKITELTDKGFNLIVFDDVKANHANDESIISYSDFVTKEYPNISRFWI